MNARLCVVLLGIVMISLSCARPARDDVPDAICGTRIDPALTRQLVPATAGWREYSRVDRTRAITAPCLVFAGDEVVLSLQFSWRPVATDLLYLAKEAGAVSGVTEPRSISFGYKTVIGTDGAISQTSCRIHGSNYFTLTLQLPQIKLTDQTHRKDIEKFMRAYFPATVKTLGCA